MNWKHIDGSVQCPFYNQIRVINKHCSIMCESAISNFKVVINTFESNSQFKQHIKEYCCKNWTNCPHAKMVEQQYNGNLF